MTLGELIQIVRDDLAEQDTTGYFTDPMIIRRLNRAQKEFVRRTKCLQTVTTFDITSGTQEYTLPSDFLDVIKVQLHFDGSPYVVRPVAFQHMSPYDGQFAPFSYYVRGNHIGFYPVPATSDTCTLFYVQTPSDMSGTTDSPSIQPIFHDMLIPKAVELCLRSDEKPALAQQCKMDFEQHVADAIRLLSDRLGDSYSVNPDPWDFDGGGA